jgi:hypothetical protein
MKLARHFRNKNKEHMKAKMRNLKLAVRSKMLGTCIGASVTLRRVYQSITSTVRDEKGDLVAESHNILARWRKHISQLLNIHVWRPPHVPFTPVAEVMWLPLHEPFRITAQQIQ